MLRKTIFALAAAATLGAAALAPTSASAQGWGWGWHGWYGPGYRVYAGPFYNDCFAQRWISTKHGHVLRWVNVCY